MNIKNINNLFAGLLILLTLDINSACQNRQNLGEAKSGGVKMPEVVNFEKPKTYQINPKDLPKPFATKSSVKPSRKIAQPVDAKLFVPKGFKLNNFITGQRVSIPGAVQSDKSLALIFFRKHFSVVKNHPERGGMRRY